MSTTGAGVGLVSGREVPQALLDQFRAGQPGGVHGRRTTKAGSADILAPPFDSAGGERLLGVTVT
jgi:hypothetical protein